MNFPLFIGSRGNLTKIHHKAQPSHEVITPFHIPHSTTDFAIPFHLQKSLNITTKGVILPLNDHFSVVDLWKDPFFRFHNAGTAGQKHPKTWKMAISSDGQVPPGTKIDISWIQMLYMSLIQFHLCIWSYSKRQTIETGSSILIRMDLPLAVLFVKLTLGFCGEGLEIQVRNHGFLW